MKHDASRVLEVLGREGGRSHSGEALSTKLGVSRAQIWKHVENPSGSQMLLRWEMQDSWPDVLITNFTMLSIMMVRDLERSLFTATRTWLDESEHNIFYFYQGSELVHIYENVISAYSVDFTKLFSYAKRREREQEIKSFLANNMNHLIEEIVDD